MRLQTLSPLAVRRSLPLFLAIVVCLAIWQVWLTWRLMEQDRNLAVQRSHERLEQIADLAVAQLGALLGDWDLNLRDLNALPPSAAQKAQVPPNETWQIWDELHGQWLNTTRACQMNVPGWYHLQWWVHRVDGDTSCDGYPCMYYDMLGIEGGYTQFETIEPAGPMPAGWSNDSGLNFQLDISGARKSATITEYIQKVNFTELGN